MGDDWYANTAAAEVRGIFGRCHDTGDGWTEGPSSESVVSLVAGERSPDEYAVDTQLGQTRAMGGAGFGGPSLP